jgi:hypothetical protein
VECQATLAVLMSRRRRSRVRNTSATAHLIRFESGSWTRTLKATQCKDRPALTAASRQLRTTSGSTQRSAGRSCVRWPTGRSSPQPNCGDGHAKRPIRSYRAMWPRHSLISTACSSMRRARSKARGGGGRRSTTSRSARSRLPPAAVRRDSSGTPHSGPTKSATDYARAGS